LRPGNTHSRFPRGCGGAHKVDQVAEEGYPGALILFRADAGFAIPAIYRYLEKQPDLRYVIAFITNNRPGGILGPDQPRRIITKVEYTRLGPNQRFVVTNLVRNPYFVYDDLYVLRGDVENRIKELKLEFKADRLSCHHFLANQFRWKPDGGSSCPPPPPHVPAGRDTWRWATPNSPHPPKSGPAYRHPRNPLKFAIKYESLRYAQNDKENDFQQSHLQKSVMAGFVCIGTGWKAFVLPYIPLSVTGKSQSQNEFCK
jgi:hypothetical protein